MTSIHDHDRELQRYARTWAQLTGSNYTTALRHLEPPIVRGILGDRVSPQRLREALEEHPDLGDDSQHADCPYLTDHGLDVAPDVYLRVALVAEVLRMFTPAEPSMDVIMVRLAASRLLKPVVTGITRGHVLWAAAALGIRFTTFTKPDVGTTDLIGISRPRFEYAWRSLGYGSAPDFHEHRPPGWERLRQAVEQYAETGQISALPAAHEPTRPPSRFHDWFITQTERAGLYGNVAKAYERCASDSTMPIVDTPEQLLEYLSGQDTEIIDVLRGAAAEYNARH